MIDGTHTHTHTHYTQNNVKHTVLPISRLHTRLIDNLVMACVQILTVDSISTYSLSCVCAVRVFAHGACLFTCSLE